MNEELRYRSHTIDLELMEIRPQRFRWLFVIDGMYLHRSNDVLQPMRPARAEALASAFGQIEALEAIAGYPLRPAAAAMHSTQHRSAPVDARRLVPGRSEEARRFVARLSLQAERAGASLDASRAGNSTNRAQPT